MLQRATPMPGRAGAGGLERGLSDRPGRRRRRPSGEPPLLRKNRWTRWIWLLAVMSLRCVTVVVLLVFGRLRHLVVFLATLVVTDWVVARLLFVELPAPDVPVLADGGGYAFPSKVVSALAITLFAMVFVLAPRGGARDLLCAGFGATLALVVLAELYLATDYLSAMVYAAILARSVADVTFRWLVPEEGSLITYRKRGNAAHLDLGGERGGRSSEPWRTSSA